MARLESVYAGGGTLGAVDAAAAQLAIHELFAACEAVLAQTFERPAR